MYLCEGSGENEVCLIEDVCLVGEGIRGLLRERTRRMVEKGVTGGSSGQYQRHWKRWLGFLGTLPLSERPDEFLLEVNDENDKVIILMAFLAYVVEELNIRGSKEVGGVLSGLRFEWNRQCLNSAIFEDPRVGAAKQGARLTTEEMREYAYKSKETRKLPVCTDMVAVMVEREIVRRIRLQCTRIIFQGDLHRGCSSVRYGVTTRQC